MKIMADLDAVHLGLDENEADIAEELQDFDDSFDTRSEASESASDSSDSQPSISSVSSAESSIGEKRNKNKTMKKVVTKENEKKAATKRTSSPGDGNVNGKKTAAVVSKKKRNNEESAHKVAELSASKVVKEKKTIKKINTSSTIKNSSATASTATNLNGPANTSSGSISAHANSSGNKSDISDAEDNTITKDPFDSDSESEDSDSAANIKRNGGRKPMKKSASPEKKLQGGLGTNASGKSYDYMTKLNYLFRGTHFFLIKSNNADNVAIAKNKNIWATLPQNEANLNQAFKESRNVLLIFSVNESGKFAGFARMGAQSRRDLPHPAWVLPPSISPKALGGIIELDWICRKELSFNCTSHLYNTWNESKPVKIGRDGQEIEPKVGAELCRLFPEDEKIEMTPILRKSKEAAKLMREKGVRVSYRPPRSLSTRGSRGGGSSGGYLSYRPSDRRISSSGGGGGPIRHRRGFGVPPHRPYKLPPLGMPPIGSFKRSSSPYRSGGGSGPGGSGGSRSGGGDSGLPSWDRYMTSAEAYMMDYMRSMHGQLPPLPFVPPFAQLPLSASGVAGLPPPGPPSMYDQLPPPVRYYDGPPLPDYPPPQPIRPPPPGFDKAPSYEDFAAWKNAGLPTLPEGMPPGFPNFSSSGPGQSASNGGGSSGLGGSSSTGGGNVSGNGGSSFSSSNNTMNSSNSAGGPNSYRSSNQRPNSSNIMRPRERIGGREYRGPSGNINTSRSGGGNERHFRPGGASSGGGGARNYRDGRR
ncbi:YTH domain-containing protein 1 [Eurosta solidaginis]|uniref:YTH domain-containing protein 1 n=1 Tax=Eurosta solidaginis TaxID=178769 RepID=UPI00353161DC